ncbi:MAG: hypothetical protein CL943_03015 [Candidatus Diapherotrites archaeon]|uniref:Uncharacterized protein n=1 Tax=Candidatus Iainarchaeum sp. TaxID=3101447 RepID=A0A2D6M1E8_9ARCH|nr:hypothetical protein [Candidatus Diapherotrites archaeon]
MSSWKKTERKRKKMKMSIGIIPDNGKRLLNENNNITATSSTAPITKLLCNSIGIEKIFPILSERMLYPTKKSRQIYLSICKKTKKKEKKEGIFTRDLS